jgi:hypothetical protein
MSTMNATGKSSGKPGIPVNRFALFAETILAGVIVLLLSVPLVTAPAAYAAGVAHLERHLSGRDDSLRSLWGHFRRALPGSWKLGLAAAGAVLFLRIAANWSGGVNWSGDAGQQPAEVPGPQRWVVAYSQAKADALRDWTGSLLLLAAVFMAVVFVWMLQALFVIVPGTLVLAAAAIKIRSNR